MTPEEIYEFANVLTRVHQKHFVIYNGVLIVGYFAEDINPIEDRFIDNKWTFYKTPGRKKMILDGSKISKIENRENPI